MIKAQKWTSEFNRAEAYLMERFPLWVISVSFVSWWRGWLRGWHWGEVGGSSRCIARVPLDPCQLLSLSFVQSVVATIQHGKWHSNWTCWQTYKRCYTLVYSGKCFLFLRQMKFVAHVKLVRSETGRFSCERVRGWWSFLGDEGSVDSRVYVQSWMMRWFGRC